MAFLKLTLTEPLKIEIKETAKQQNQTVGEYVEELHRTHITPTTYKQKFLYTQWMYIRQSITTRTPILIVTCLIYTKYWRT